MTDQKKQDDELIIRDVETLTRKIESLPEEMRVVVVMHAGAFISGLEASANLGVVVK
jgi:hypothetical protein